MIATLPRLSEQKLDVSAEIRATEVLIHFLNILGTCQLALSCVVRAGKVNTGQIAHIA